MAEKRDVDRHARLPAVSDPIRLVVTTEEQLRAIIRDEVRAAMKDLDDGWVDPDQVAKWLGVKRATLRVFIKRDGLPVHYPGGGRKYKFRREEVEAWLLERASKAGAQSSKHGRSLRRIREDR